MAQGKSYESGGSRREVVRYDRQPARARWGAMFRKIQRFLGAGGTTAGNAYARAAGVILRGKEDLEDRRAERQAVHRATARQLRPAAAKAADPQAW